MSLLDDLTLGSDRFEEEEPLNLRGAGPVQGYPLEPLVSPFEQPNAKPPEPVGPYEYPVDPARAQDYKDLKSFNTDTKAAGTRASEYEGLASAKSKLLADFEGGLMQKHWDSMFHDPDGIEDVPVLKRGKKPVDEWYKELDDHVGMRFGDDSINHKKLKQLKQRHGALYKDWDRADKVGRKARFQHTAMLDTYLSTPENLREASKSWKEENPEKEISPAAQEKVLDDTQFEEPSFDPFGLVTNPKKIDPRLRGLDKTKITKKEAELRRQKYRTDYDAKSKEKTLSKNLRKHGWLYSKMAEVAGRSIFLTEDERDHLDLADAAKSGWVKYVGGQPVEEVLESLGGTEKETVARIIDNVGKAHAQWERVQLAFVGNWKEKGYDQAKEVLELERKKWGAVLQTAAEYGLTNRVIAQGKSGSYWSSVIDEFKAGIKDEDATEIVPELAGLEELTRSDVTEFIQVMQDLQDHPQSEILTKFQEKPSKTWFEGAMKFVRNPEVIPLMAARVISSYGNTFLDNALTTVTTGAGVGLLTGGPRGAITGGSLALRANIGLTSGVMEYAQTFTREMEKEGIDWQNPDIFMKAFTNPDLLSRLRKNPMLRAVAVGGTDQAFNLVAGRTAQLVKRPAAIKKLPNGLTAFKAELNQGVQASARRQILAGAAELGTGAVFGASGESLAQYLTEGGITDIDAVLAEGVLEMAGPGGWSWALNSLNNSLTGDLTLEDLTKAEAKVLSSNRDESGVVEDIDQNGWKYQRRRFDSANQLISYLESKGKLDTSTPEGYIFARMMGFAGLTGHLQKLGVVISDRTPLSEKNTRGGYHKGVIFMNEKALEGRESTASHVLLHEGGHFIQDFMMAPDEAWALYTEALPDEESRKLSYANYLFGRRVTDLSNLSNKELRILNRQFGNASQDLMVAEWITQQMGLALATISGLTTTAEKLNPDIKKKVQTLIEKVIVGDDAAVNQFFPPELGGTQEQASMALLKALGFHPATLEHNRRKFNEQGTFGPGGNREGMYNPTLVDFTGIENFTPQQKEQVAKAANFRSWDDIPQAWKDEAIEIWGGKKAEVPTTVDEGGQVSMDLENVVPAEPAIADLSDPDVQDKIREGDPQARKASPTQEEGQGLDSLAASPEKKPLSSPIKDALDKALKAPKEDTDRATLGQLVAMAKKQLDEDTEYTPELLEKLKSEKQKIEESQKEMAEKSKAKKKEAEQGKEVELSYADKIVQKKGERVKPGTEPSDPSMEWREDEDGKPVLVKKRAASKKEQAEHEAEEEQRKEQAEKRAEDREKEKEKKEKAEEEVKKKQKEERSAEAAVKRLAEAEKQEVTDVDQRKELSEEIKEHSKMVAERDKEYQESNDKAAKQAVDNALTNHWKAFGRRIDRAAADIEGKEGLYPTTARILVKLLKPDATKADLNKPFDELFAGADTLSKFFKNLEDGKLDKTTIEKESKNLTELFKDAFPNLAESEEIVKNVLMPFGVHQIDKKAYNRIFNIQEEAEGTQQVWEDSEAPVLQKSFAGIGARDKRHKKDGVFTAKHEKIVNDLLEGIDKDTTIHSGAAEGADTAFEAFAEKTGSKVLAHTGPFKPKEHRGGLQGNNYKIHSRAELNAADPYLDKAGIALKREWRDKTEFVKNLFRRNYYQIKDVDQVVAIAPIKDGIVQGGTAWAVQMALDMGKEVYVYDINANKWVHQKGTGTQDAGTKAEDTQVKGINISSYESGLGGKLTNFAKIPGGTPATQVITDSKGVEYKTAEDAYQAKKKELPNLSDANVLKLMTAIITAKLEQNPILIDEISDKGGIEFLNESTHNLIKDGKEIKTDRWTGKDGLFMQALRSSYKKLRGERRRVTIEEDIGEVGQLVNFTVDQLWKHRKPPEGAYAWRIVSKTGQQDAELNDALDMINAQLDELEAMGVFEDGKLDPKNPIWQELSDSVTEENFTMIEFLIGNINRSKMALRNQLGEFESKLRVLEGTPPKSRTRVVKTRGGGEVTIDTEKGEEKISKDSVKKPQAWKDIEARLDQDVKDKKVTEKRAQEERKRIRIRWERDTQGAVWDKKKKEWKHTGKPVDKKLLDAYRYDFKAGKWKLNKMALKTAAGAEKVLSDGEKKVAATLKSHIKITEDMLTKLEEFEKTHGKPEEFFNEKGEKETAPSKMKRSQMWRDLMARGRGLLSQHERRLENPNDWYYGRGIEYELESVTAQGARQDLNWLDLPVSHLHGGAANNTFSNSFEQHMKTGWRIKKYGPTRKDFFPIKRQYISIEDALADKNKKQIREMEKVENLPEGVNPAPKEIPVKELVRLISRHKDKDSPRNGLLHTETEPASPQHVIGFDQSKRIMSLILAQLESVGQVESNMAITDMQNRLKHLRDTATESVAEKPLGYQKSRLPRDSDGKVMGRSQLYALIDRIQRQRTHIPKLGKPMFGADPNDMIIHLLAGSEKKVGMTNYEMMLMLLNHYAEGTTDKKKSRWRYESPPRTKESEKAEGEKRRRERLKGGMTTPEYRERVDALREEIRSLRVDPDEKYRKREIKKRQDELRKLKKEFDSGPRRVHSGEMTTSIDQDIYLSADKPKETVQAERKVHPDGEPGLGYEFIEAPTQDQLDNIHDFAAGLDVMSHQTDTPETRGDVDSEMARGDSIRSKHATQREKYLPSEFNVTDEEIARAVPEEFDENDNPTWQYEWLFGVGLEKAYDYVKSIIQYLKESKKDKTGAPIGRDMLAKMTDEEKKKKFEEYGLDPDEAFPEVQLLSVPTSKIQDTRFANWHILSPVVVANWLEKHGLANLVSVPWKTKIGNITHGSLAGGWIWQTKAINKAITHYGKLTKGMEGVPDAGITAAEIAKRAKTAFENRLVLFEQQHQEAVNESGKGAESREAKAVMREKEQFIDLFGDPTLRKKNKGALMESQGPSKDHKMSFPMEASENIWGEKTTTLAEAESERRTATTRSFALGNVGELVTFEKGDTQYRITKVEKLTAENTKDKAWIKEWSKAEGWTVEKFQELLESDKKTVQVGSFQTHFEKVEGVPTERRKAAVLGYVQSYAAQWLRKRGAQVGGIVSSQQMALGDIVESEGETVTDESAKSEDLDSQESRQDAVTEESSDVKSSQKMEVEDIGPGADMSTANDPNDIMEDIEIDEKGVVSKVKETHKARFQKIAKMTATEIKQSKDPFIEGVMKQNLGPTELKKILKIAMSPKQFTGPEMDKLITKKAIKQDVEAGLAKKVGERIPDVDLRNKLQAVMTKQGAGLALGSELGLATDAPSLLHDRDVLAIRAAMMGGYTKLPESWKKKFTTFTYRIRLGISNQHASLEDMGLRINKHLFGDKLTPGMDFFDMMGTIIPTFAKTKTASRIFRAKYREPLMESLKKVGYSMKEAGRLFQNLGALTFNHKIRMKLKEARKEAQKILDKSINQQETAEKEWAKLPDDKKTEELTKAHEKSLEEHEKTQKKQKEEIKAFGEDQYFNDKGEFRPSGISNNEMATYLERERKKTRFTGLAKLAEDKNALGIWTRMNARTIQVQLETGQITFGEAVALIASSSIAQTPQKLEALVAEHLGLLDNDGKFKESTLDEADLAEWNRSKQIFEDTFKSEEHKELVAFAKQHQIPDGYYYAPMRGFENNEFHYEEREEIDELLSGGAKRGQKGWNAASGNKVSEYSKGRGKGVDRPDPSSAIAHATMAHDEAVMRGTKQVPGQRMREWYELFLAMHDNQEAIKKGDKIKWSKETLDVLKSNNLLGAFKDPSKLKFLWKEFNGIFDHTTESELGIAPTKEAVKIQLKTQTDKATGETFTRPVIRRGEYPVPKDSATVFLVKSKGKLQFVKFKENIEALRMVRELGNMDGFVMPKLIQPVYGIINSITRLLANAYTSWSPEFIITNAVKDMLGGVFNLTEDSKKGVIGAVGRDLFSYGKIVKAIFDVEKSTTEGTRSVDYANMTKEEAVKNIASDDWKSWFKFFEAHGMRTSFTAPETLRDSMRQIQRDLKDTDAKFLESPGDWAYDKKMKIANNAVVKWVEHANAAVENTMRLVTAKNLLTSTDPNVNFTTQQAVMAGRNITVDFNRKGVFSSNVGAFYVFFNASVQGTIRFLKSIGHRSNATKWAFGIVGVSVLHGVLSRMMTIRDDDEEEGPGNWYDDHPEWVKNTTLALHFGGKEHLKIPLPWGPNLLWMAGQKIANVVSGQMGLSVDKNGIIENGLDAIGDIHSTINPIAQSKLPTFIAPFVQVSQNENFFGGTISREDDDFAKSDTPGAYRHKYGTKEIFVNFAQWMNSVKGGDRVTPGSLQRWWNENHIGDDEDDMFISTMSGSDWEHLFNATGGLMKNLSQVFSGAASLAEGQVEMSDWKEDTNWDQIPFVSRFYGKEPKQSGAYYAYKRLSRRANEAVTGIEEKKGNVSPQQYKDFLSANRPYIPLLKMVDDWEKDRKKITAKIAKIEDSNLSAAEKLDRVRPLEKQRVVRMRKILHYAYKHNIDV